MQKTLSEKIGISGYGCCCGAGIDHHSAWDTLKQGRVNCVMDPARYFVPGREAPLFLVNEEEILDIITSGVVPSSRSGDCPIALNKLNRTILLTLAAMINLLKTAGVSLDSLQEKRVGVAVGTTVGCTFNNEDYYFDWKNNNNPDPAIMDQYLFSNLAEVLQKFFGLRGPRAVVTNACASGTDAIGVGKSWLENDLCDCVIVGGADGIARIGCRGFNSLMLVSSTACRPFDKDRNGLTLGEGAGLLLMEKEQEIKKRHGRLFGRLLGYGSSCDAYHPTAPHPEGRGLQQAIRNCLGGCGLTPEDIGLINSHGTGTLANDSAETTALSQCGFDGDNTTIISTKGATGHTLGAAGGVEAVLTLISLNKGYSPGTIGCRNQDPKLPISIVTEGEQRELPNRLGMSQSLAFGGSNGVVILEGCSG